LSATPVSVRSIPGQSHYFCRIRMSLLSVASLLLVIGLLAAAWFLLDSAWKPSQPTGSRGERSYSLLFLLVLIPVWIRVPLIVFMALEFMRRIIQRLFHIFDDKPDFVISTDGIAGWDRMTFCIIPWAEMSDVKVRRTEIRPYGFKMLPTQEWIYIYGTETGPRRFFGAFPPRRPSIMYSQMYFPKKNTEILLAIRPYRPDLVNAAPIPSHPTEIPRA